MALPFKTPCEIGAFGLGGGVGAGGGGASSSTRTTGPVPAATVPVPVTTAGPLDAATSVFVRPSTAPPGGTGGTLLATAETFSGTFVGSSVLATNSVRVATC